jgi:hypothetical protein
MPRADSTNTTIAPAVDPVAEIGRRLEELAVRRDEIEAAGFNRNEPGIYKIYRDGALDDVDDQIDCLRAYATTMRATSLEGALVQIGLADLIFDDATENRLKEWDLKVSRLRHRRLIHSAVGQLIKVVDLDTGAIGLWRSLGENQDPWTPYEKRVATIIEEHPEHGRCG